MKWKPGRIPDAVLFVIFLISIAFFVAVLLSESPRKAPYFDEKLKASQTMDRAMALIKEERLKLGIPIDPVNDPNGTGLIGHQFSPITSERGDLEEKLTSTNPNMAALMVKYLEKLKLKKGDVVAVGWTGSYPGLNLALLSALHSMEIEPIIITSLSSSMWGANDPQLTWLDMERIVQSVLPYRSAAASIGGKDDIGRGLSPQGIELLKEAIERNGIPLLYEEDISKNVEKRLAIYREKAAGKPIKAYVNIGYGRASLGPLEAVEYIKPGVNRHIKKELLQWKSVAIEMLKDRIPVLNVVDIRMLAAKNGLPVAPVPLPRPGEGKLFYEMRYSPLLAGILAVVLAAILFGVASFNLTGYLLKRREES